MTNPVKKDTPSLRDLEQANGRKLNKIFRLDIGTAVAVVVAIGGGFFWGGGLDSRVDSLEMAEASGIPRAGARKELKEIRNRVGKIETGQEVLKEKAKQGETQRNRMEGKIDSLIRRLTPPPRGPR